MDYESRIVVEKVAISSQEVSKRDTITSYALQCPTSIGELGLCHTEQIALLEKVQNILLAEQALLLAPGGINEMMLLANSGPFVSERHPVYLLYLSA